MAKQAGILFGRNFKNSANYAKKFLKKKGFAVTTQAFNYSTVEKLPKFAHKMNLMVWYSHGGWDGPVVFDDGTTSALYDQVSPSETSEWKKLKGYFGSQMQSRGVFIVHACHSAGSDSWEKRVGKGDSSKIWVRDVAKDMKLYTFGQAGLAGAANLATVKKLLEFAFTSTRRGYPFKAYAPGGIRITARSMWPRL